MIDLVFRGMRRIGLSPPGRTFLCGAGYLRHLQATRESGPDKGPDHLVGAMLGPAERLRARLEDMDAIRGNAFYRYLLARTRHYDRVVSEALNDGVTQVLSFGIGTDTRAHRFADRLNEAGVRVIETDLDPWLSKRRRRSRRLPCPTDFHQLPLDLESAELGAWAKEGPFDPDRPTLFVAEGVTPYLTPVSVSRWLRFISKSAASGSRLVYDGKFGSSDDTGLFRLPTEPAELATLHEATGVTVESTITSADLHCRLTESGGNVFDQDLIVAALKP